MLQNIGLSTGLFNENDLLFQFLGIANFAIAPIFYLSVCFYATPFSSWKHRDYLHFAFAFLMLLIIVASLFLDQEIPAETITTAQQDSAEHIFNLLFGLQLTVYCVLAYQKIAKHRQNILLLNSSIEYIELKWLQNLCIGVMVLAFFWLADILFKLSDTSSLVDDLTSLLYLTGVLYIAYQWLRQKEIFPYNLGEQEELKAIIAETTQQELEKKKLVPDDKLEELKTQVRELIETHKPYLADDLNLIKLAEQLNMSSHQLSYVINNGFNENFYQLINRYRVEEAKKLILDPKMDHLSLLGIAFEVGFSSKTVFNTTFKKMTGQTPSEYKRNKLAKTGSD
ncbi:AraC family transcriptional regulator [Pedobacter sp. KR3-3]|uniref:AraC family transcriptional regulator n=1 Tax=Pedobacter albus TaxID=3113905 RepID=A0ABU7I2Z5_9SPHI|nr:AraC family transcriptional regulator [Pedobacter sp. KR3-3]MEE1943777.1 AraC family transcriptional regulator [Pedobacter sp. KR3-3]